MPHTSLTAQVSTHTPCAPHASRPLLSCLAHRKKNSQLASRTAQKNLACSGAGSPRSKLAAAKRACSSASSDCEALRSSCSLPALLNMRWTPADQVLPRHLGERREPLGAAGREIFRQIVIARLPPCEQVQVHIADGWQCQVLLQIIEAAGCRGEYRQVPCARR